MTRGLAPAGFPTVPKIIFYPPLLALASASPQLQYYVRACARSWAPCALAHGAFTECVGGRKYFAVSGRALETAAVTI